MDSTLSLTKYWLENIVIGLDLCPFARIPFESGLIRVVECKKSDEDDQMIFFLEELEFLNQAMPSDVSTTVIVYPNASNDFSLFNDFIGELEFMLEEAALENIFQLVAFHPEFVFENTDSNEIGNLVNRSPFPTLHILRSEEVARAMKNPADGEVISFNNNKKLNELSSEAIDQLFYYLKK
ncbi:MAG: DUF1415 domain-containing protein [Bacteriovorax sp.]|nr:DUF1415 domain-containing protein [Bacteriovorax sp.]